MIWSNAIITSEFVSINGKRLDKSQIKIITSRRKYVLVIAGAGCGKTITIVGKVKYLIGVKKVKPSEILCISFTNDAVNKLKEDLNEKDVDIMTFHKLALKIIGKTYEVLTEDMLKDIIIDTFSNYKLLSLYDISKKEIYNVIETFINLFKSNNYKLDKFYEFINKADYKDKVFLKEIMKCYICYDTYLKKENLIDFNDMINIAIKRLDYSNIRYKYIIIDEYQDTSITKFNLIYKLLKLSNASLFVVGDDFQSIYRFNGSDIKLITNFRKYFPFAKIFKLNRTYRNSIELVKVAGKFIMKNKLQVPKKLISNRSLKNCIQIVYYDDLNEIINRVIEEDNIDNLFVIARNNRDLDNVNINNNIKYKKLTAHKSKGLQANDVFIINLNNNKNGFPNKYVDHKILKYVNNYKEYYPYEEERRLFYVALTRCINRVYLFVPKDNESIFVKELKKYKNVIIREK